MGDPQRVNKELYDLRWVLDSFETWTEDNLPAVSRESRVWFEQINEPGIVARVTGRFETSVDLWHDSRRQLAEVLSWMSSSQTARLIKVGQQADKRSARLQRTVSVLGALVVGPGLVAAAFDAQSSWWDGHDFARSAVMIVGMAIAARSAVAHSAAGGARLGMSPREVQRPSQAIGAGPRACETRAELGTRFLVPALPITDPKRQNPAC